MNVFFRTFERFVPGGCWSRTFCVLIFAIAGTSLVDRFHPATLTDVLAWNANGHHGLIRLLTYPLIGGVELAVGLVLLGLLGGDVASLMGPRRWLGYWLLISFGSAMVSILLLPQTAVTGPLGPAVGMALAFWFLFPHRRRYGFAPTWMVSILGVAGAFLALFLLPPPAGGGALVLPAFVQSIGAVAMGASYFLIRPFLQRQRAARLVVRRALEIQREDYEKERLDHLLEKISVVGTGSLNRSERRFLRQAARSQRERQAAIHPGT